MIDVAAYGKALFDLAAEIGEDTRVQEELDVLCTVLKQEPDYVTLLDTPAIPTEEKLKLLNEAFAGVQPMLGNFLCLLCEKRAMHLLPGCANAYRACYDEAHELLRATAITARPMSERQCTALRETLARKTGKTVVLENRTDPTLIGGMTLRYGGVQLDDSLKAALDKLRRSLSDTIV